MADVFVSYARNDEQTAVRVAQCLSDAGYQVWRDDQLPAHRAYAEVIEERLKCAKAVIVLWSAEAAKSQWVRAEADAARVAGTLVQASLDGSLPPMPFNQIQCADLMRWTGEAAAPGWRKLLDSIAALAPPTTSMSWASITTWQLSAAPHLPRAAVQVADSAERRAPSAAVGHRRAASARPVPLSPSTAGRSR